MDPLSIALHLPKLAERAMRAAVAAGAGRAATPRALIEGAQARFERGVAAVAADGIRPELLFGERDRIVRELRGFVKSRLAVRLFALHRRDVLATAAAAAPFDAILRGRDGKRYALRLCRLETGAPRLEILRRIHDAAASFVPVLDGVLVYDFTHAAVRLLRLRDAAAQRHDRDLRARAELELGQDVRDVVLHGLVAERQPPADLLVREPLHEQVDDLKLAGGEPGAHVAFARGAGKRTKPPRRRPPLRGDGLGELADGQAADLAEVRIPA
ncbi:MAG TPA: hypothetical protein VMH02_06620 [Verrucomicrobiae bacterium]|nr:hypothetical protein [Verrucomicrobiae bacterium]